MNEVNFPGPPAETWTKCAGHLKILQDLRSTLHKNKTPSIFDLKTCTLDLMTSTVDLMTCRRSRKIDLIPF